MRWKQGIQIDDKVLVIAGPHEGVEGYVFSMVCNGATMEVEQVMVSTYAADGTADEYFSVLPSQVVVTGKFEIPA